jgi:hypothetical protein
VSGGHEINCSLWYDADDLTTADDGYSIFVTAGGARWKADVSEGLMFAWPVFWQITQILVRF